MCGSNSLCNNYPGNYTCTCQDGYAGDPYTGVCTLTNIFMFGTKYFICFTVTAIILLAKSDHLNHPRTHKDGYCLGGYTYSCLLLNHI